MTLNIKMNHQIALLASILTLTFALGACSSKPSPWSQQGSPWAEAQTESAVATEDAQPAMVEESAQAVNDAPAPWVAEPEATVAAATVEDMGRPEPMMEESAPMMESAEMTVSQQNILQFRFVHQVAWIS